MSCASIFMLWLASNFAGASALAVGQRKMQRGEPTTIDQKAIRPSAGKGADVIEFGLVVKNFYGTNLKTNQFKVDVVMSLSWKDLRVIDLIPAGLQQLTMSTTQADDMIWRPEVVVTNRDIDQYEIISSSVTIFKSGQVRRSERAMVRVCDMFKLSQYPFDYQNLEVKIGSSKYMMNELILVPSKNKNIAGTNAGSWYGYNLIDWELSTFDEVDGDLKKSRGMIGVRVKRELEKYRQDHLVPTFILVVISWAVFYFPFVGPFITPRLVLSILALLTFTNLMIKSTKALPGAAPFNWNDLFNQQIQILMFATIVINVLTEVIHHQLQVSTVSIRVNHEAKVVLPFLSASNIAIILSAAYFEYMSLGTATFLTQTMVAVLLGGYIFWIVSITRNEIIAREEASKHSGEMAGEGEQGEAEADAGDGGDADAGC